MANVNAYVKNKMALITTIQLDLISIAVSVRRKARRIKIMVVRIPVMIATANRKICEYLFEPVVRKCLAILAKKNTGVTSRMERIAASDN